MQFQKKSRQMIVHIIILFAFGFLYHSATRARTLGEITGRNLSYSKNTYLKIIHVHKQRVKIDRLQSDDPQQITLLLEYLKSLKYSMGGSKNLTTFLKNESFNIYLISGEDSILNLTVLDEKYLTIEDKSGFSGLYKVKNGNINYEFLNKFYKSLE